MFGGRVLHHPALHRYQLRTHGVLQLPHTQKFTAVPTRTAAPDEVVYIRNRDASSAAAATPNPKSLHSSQHSLSPGAKRANPTTHLMS
jgi:hypothetical protein